MKRSNHTTYRVGLALLGLLTLLLAPRASALAASSTPTFTTLHTFSALSGNMNADGANPGAGLVQGRDGDFYGTSQYGGAQNAGTVFKITPSGSFTTLYSFTGGNDGASPFAVLIQGSDGNLYGTSSFGGASGVGTVFKITPSGVLTTLHSFTDGADGGCPRAGLAQGSDGSFYGTTRQGGANNDGTVFKITPSGTLTTLHSFAGTDGFFSVAGLVQGSDGCFYGTTLEGGANGYGSVFKITAAGAFTSVYSFSALTGSLNADGAYPSAGLVQGSDGNFYGTTFSGGSSGAGTVFKIMAGVTGSLAWAQPLSAWFGGNPAAALVVGSDGNLYGTTSSFGSNGYGVIFEVSPAGALTSLYSFTGGGDGCNPEAALIQGSDGSFYGTTVNGGANGKGAIFKLTVPGVGPAAGSTYALWNHSGQASLWKIPASGSTTSASFGPFAGWTPVGLASDTSSNAYMLWTSTTGAASVWKLSSSLALTTSQSFGPFSGWTAKSIAVGPDGNVHILWNGPSNAASIYNVVLGGSVTSKAYGPFTGWQATQIAVDSNNNTRVLWTNAAASQASLWNITSAGVQTSQSFGPYSGWQAQSLAMGSDNLARMLWAQTSTKQASVFTVASSGSVTSKALGPYTGWTPTGLAVNKDGDSDLMWTGTSNALSLFDIGSTGSFTSSGYGPYSGWTPVAIAAGP